MYFLKLCITIVIITIIVLTNNSATKRISELKCEEYMEYLPPAESPYFLLPPPFETKPKLKCEVSISKFIIGGRNADTGEYPFQVAIGYETNNAIVWGCAGGLISNQFVITAAHCIKTDYGPPRHILAGDTILSERKHLNKNRQIFGVAETYINPGYIPPVKYNDLALIQLDRKLNLSSELMPACLAQNGAEFNNETGLTVSGWGWMKALEKEMQPDNLQTVNLSLWDRTECNTFFTDGVVQRRYPDGIIESQICAGDKTGDGDTCQGDSGSPLVFKKPVQCIYYIAGVTHGGSSICGLSTPGIYTNVTSYLDWIEGIVWPNDALDANDSNQKLNPENIRLHITPNKTKLQENVVNASAEATSNAIKEILGLS